MLFVFSGLNIAMSRDRASSYSKGIWPFAIDMFSLMQLDSLSAVRIYIPKDLRAIEPREHCRKTVSEVLRRFPDGIQLLDPEDDMQVLANRY